MLWLAVGVGGALGSIARHSANIITHRLVGQSVPYATAIVNVLGCFTIGLLAGVVASGTWRIGETARVFVFVGILGGFTTFSSLGLDTLTLVRSGETSMALANVAAQVGLGLPSVFGGYWLAKWL
jgi:fluoride exporter